MSGLERYQMLIDGEWVDAGDGGSFESINPATGEPWAVIPEATAGRCRPRRPGGASRLQRGRGRGSCRPSAASICAGWPICWPTSPRSWAASRPSTAARC